MERPLSTRHAVIDLPEDHWNRTWRLELTSDDQVEACFKSSFYSSHAQKMNVADRIRVRLPHRRFEFWLSVSQKPTKSQVIVRWIRPDVPKFVIDAFARVEREDRELVKTVSTSKH